MKKRFDFIFYRRNKHSGVYLLPTLILNTSYKTLTFDFWRFVLEIRYNDYKHTCFSCGEIRKNKQEADACCLNCF
jgi:hypothetical protein